MSNEDLKHKSELLWYYHKLHECKEYGIIYDRFIVIFSTLFIFALSFTAYKIFVEYNTIQYSEYFFIFCIISAFIYFIIIFCVVIQYDYANKLKCKEIEIFHSHIDNSLTTEKYDKIELENESIRKKIIAFHAIALILFTFFACFLFFSILLAGIFFI